MVKRGCGPAGDAGAGIFRCCLLRRLSAFASALRRLSAFPLLLARCTPVRVIGTINPVRPSRYDGMAPCSAGTC